MFPLQRSEDLVFQIFSNNHPDQNKISQDLMIFDNNCTYNYAPLDVTTTHHHKHFPSTATAAATTTTTTTAITATNSSRKRQQRDGVFLPDEITAATVDDNHDLKRIMHREIERQRRQEMATLYASLRSLLPLEYVKGKRSTSDHMHEALNYIKQMQKNVQELERRRDRLKNSSSTSSGSHSLERNNDGSSSDQKTSQSDRSQNFVSVDRCHDGGMEVLINCDGGDGGRSCFPVSRVLRTLLKEGFDVVSCDSTKAADNRLLLRVQSQVISDEKHTDIQALQQKLTEVINF